MLHNINIFIHVLFGLTAIGIGIMPYISKKGGQQHRRFGCLFLILMAVVIITALNGVLLFRDRPFLTVVTFQSFYMSYSGFRVLKTKENGFEWVDFLVMLLVGMVGIGFMIKMKSANIVWNAGIVYYLLGYLFLVIAFDMLRFLKPNLIKSKRFWIYDHTYKMTSAFTALFSAGVGTVLSGWEPYSQIVPAMLGTSWLVFCLIYFPRQVRY